VLAGCGSSGPAPGQSSSAKPGPDVQERIRPAATISPTALGCITTITGEHIQHDLDVPAEATCTLDHVVVDGNVRVDAGGSLTWTDTRVVGDVTAASARSVGLDHGQITGKLSILGSAGTAAVSWICDLHIESGLVIRQVQYGDVVAVGNHAFPDGGDEDPVPTDCRGNSIIAPVPSPLYNSAAVDIRLNQGHILFSGNSIDAPHNGFKTINIFGNTNERPCGSVEVEGNYGFDNLNCSLNETVTGGGPNDPFDPGSPASNQGGAKHGQCAAM
jgi:hypothetical protein